MYTSALHICCFDLIYWYIYMTREQSKRQVLAEYPVAWTVLQMTENSLHPYHLTVYVFILVSLWKKNFMASSDKLWRKARGRHQASMSHVFLPVIMLTTLFGTRRGVSHCSHRSKEFDRKKNFSFVDRVWIFDWSLFEDEARSFLTSQQSSTP